MAKSKSGSRAPDSVRLSYQLLRNTTSPDEKAIDIQSFVMNLPAAEALKLDTKENLREYLAEHNPRRRNRVHDAIRNTILTEPQRFIVRNGGLVITASSASVNDQERYVDLVNPSIVNGAQTQGEIRRYLEELAMSENGAGDEVPFYVRAELIVDPDPAEVVETAIARNTATPVKSLSQAGARGQLEELEASILKMLPNRPIRKKETDEDVLDTRKVLQYARLLMPESVSENSSPAEKLRAYKNPEQCLTEFTNWHRYQGTNPHMAAMYEFAVQIAPYAIIEYEYWETHDGWNGQYLWEATNKGGRACRREDKLIVWVAPGIVFPVLSGIGEFVVHDKKRGWHIEKPSIFKPDEMIRRAVSQFRAHGSDPMQMGRSEGAYDALRIYPQTLVQVLGQIKS